VTDVATSVAPPPGETPKGSAASSAASAALDNAKHARPPRFGDEDAKLEAKPFARHHAFGRRDNRPPNLGSPAGQRTTPAPNDSVNPDRAELARLYDREAGPLALGRSIRCRMRSTPTRVDGVLAPRTTPSAGTGKGARRLATAVILCSGVEGQGRSNAALLATSRSPRRAENLRADVQGKIWTQTAKREG